MTSRLLSNTTRARVAECVRRLDSDGETLSAVRAIREALAAEGRDLNTLADLIAGVPTWGRSMPLERLRWLRLIVREQVIDDKERALVWALGVALKSDPCVRPDKIEVRVVNKWIARLYKRGVRP